MTDALDGPRFYRHSGRFGALGAIAMVTAGVAVAAVGGAVYAYATIYIPFIYLNALCTLGYGALAGWVVALAARFGKVRSRGFAALGGAVAGFNALYAAWIWWFFVKSGHEHWVMDFGELWEWASAVAEEGSFSIGKSSPSGLALRSIWLAEAGLIIVPAAWIAGKQVGERPFCEDCGRWGEPLATLAPLRLPEALDPEGLAQELRRGHQDRLGVLARTRATARTFLEVERWKCPACDAFDLATVQRVQLTKDKDGDDVRKATVLARLLYLDDDGRGALAAVEASTPDVGDAEAEAEEPAKA